MKVKVICEFFDCSVNKPRHIGEVLTLSKKNYTSLLSAGLVELVLDTKTSNKSRNNKGNKQKDDVQTNDPTNNKQNDDSTEDNQNDDLKDADKENKDNK